MLSETVSGYREAQLRRRHGLRRPPGLQQHLAPARVALAGCRQADDAVGPEMPEGLAQFAPGDDQPYMVEAGQRERPDGAGRLGVLQVPVDDVEFLLGADRLP